jgi:rubrerythrin
MKRRYPHPYVWRKIKESGAYMKGTASSSENIFPDENEDIHSEREFSTSIKSLIEWEDKRRKKIEKKLRNSFESSLRKYKTQHKKSKRKKKKKGFRCKKCGILCRYDNESELCSACR